MKSILETITVVYADRLINNSVLPENKEEFLHQVIASANSSDTVCGNGSEYYGDYNAKIVISTDYMCEDGGEYMFMDVQNTDEQYGYRINPVDGYFISFVLDYDEKEVDPYQNGAIKDEYLKTDSDSIVGYKIPLYAKGTITNMEIAGSNGISSYQDLMRGTVKITFYINSFETYQ